jgi:mRNA interferase MazF
MKMHYPLIQRGEIWLADLGMTVGSEESGRRPVIIIQNDIGNEYSPTVIIAAVTARQKKFMPTHVRLPRHDNRLRRESTILTEQLRTIDRARLIKPLGRLTAEELAKADDALGVSIGLNYK